MPDSPAKTPTPQPSRGRSCLLMFGLLLAYLVASVMLLLLPTGFIGPMFVGGGFVLVFVFGVHYVIWGRWLSQVLAEGTQRSAEKPDPGAGRAD